MSNRISFEFSASNQFLSDLFEQALDQAVASEPMEVNSVEVKLRRVGEAELKPLGKKIEIRMPLHIDVKRQAGLFTVEGNGAINLDLEVNFNIDEKLQLKAKTDLISHEWIEKPILEIGALNIPIETLVNLVLNHYESIITGKLDDSLKQISNLNNLLKDGLEIARENINDLELKGNRFQFSVNSVALVEPSLKENRVHLNGYIEPQVRINGHDLVQADQVAFRWIENEQMESPTSLPIQVSLPYDVLKEELLVALEGMEVGGKYFEVVKADIDGGEELAIRMLINEPIKAEVFITGKPVYNEIEGAIFMSDLDVKVNPANFIYKLTAPLVNKFVEGKMEEFFPFEINKRLGEVIDLKIPKSITTPGGEVLMKYGEIQIEQLSFEKDSIEAVAKISNAFVSVRN